jgi:2'-5' RNA ligase
MIKMNLIEHYNTLYNDSVKDIRSDAYKTDFLIDSNSDNRFGLTLLTRPDDTVKNKIQVFLSDLKTIEPNQYYYPNSDIHVTVLSIISCYSGFHSEQIPISDYSALINNSLFNSNSFDVEFRGITASSSCIMIQGFPSDQTLERIRNKLRHNFKNSPLQQSIDTRYSINTSHATVSRFRTAFKRKTDYISVLEDYRNFYFGTFKVTLLELLFNDWYLKSEASKTLDKFHI